MQNRQEGEDKPTWWENMMMSSSQSPSRRPSSRRPPRSSSAPSQSAPAPTPEPEPEVFDTSSYRDTLYKAMKGIGTDTDAIDRVINRTTKEQRRKIRQDWDDNKSRYGGETLREWIEGDFSWATNESYYINSFY